MHTPTSPLASKDDVNVMTKATRTLGAMVAVIVSGLALVSARERGPTPVTPDVRLKPGTPAAAERPEAKLKRNVSEEGVRSYMAESPKNVAAEQELTAWFEAELARLELEPTTFSLACRGSICATELGFPERTQAQRLKAAAHRPMGEYHYIAALDGGNVALTIYSTLPGTAFEDVVPSYYSQAPTR